MHLLRPAAHTPSERREIRRQPMLNTTEGAKPNPARPEAHIINTSRVVEEDIVYEDEEPETVNRSTGEVVSSKRGRGV
jgi:hypothetical protein